jgi:hypothetical protein
LNRPGAGAGAAKPAAGGRARAGGADISVLHSADVVQLYPQVMYPF